MDVLEHQDPDRGCTRDLFNEDPDATHATLTMTAACSLVPWLPGVGLLGLAHLCALQRELVEQDVGGIKVLVNKFGQ